MSSGRLKDYLGKGLAADRPASLDLHPEAVGFYYATDAEVWSAWDGTDWIEVVNSAPDAEAIPYDNSTSGLDAEDVQAAIDELAAGSTGAVSSVNGQTGAVVLDAGGVGAATAAQGALADSAVQPSGLSSYAPLASPALTGTPTAPTASPLTSNTQVATTKYVDDAVAAGGGGGGAVVDVQTPTNSSGTVTLDFAGKTRYVGSITLAANVATLAFDNLPGAGKFAEYELHVTQDGTGSRTFAIPASHKALGGSDTAIASAANAVTVLSASTVDNGTTWRYAMQESA